MNETKISESKGKTRYEKRVALCEAIYSDLVLEDLINEFPSHKRFGGDIALISSGFEKKVYKRYIKKKKFYLAKINQLLRKDWEAERLNLSILAILLELLSEYEEFKTPPSVLIQQGVELAKKYGEEEHKLVHALVDSYLKQLSC